MSLFFPDNKLSKRFDDLERAVNDYVNIINRGEAVTENVAASFEYQAACIVTALDLETLIRAIMAALNTLADKLWPDGKRKSWWKWVMAIPEIAIFLISMFKALKNQPAK